MLQDSTVQKTLSYSRIAYPKWKCMIRWYLQPVTGAENIYIHVHKDNLPAWRLYDQIGFKVRALSQFNPEKFREVAEKSKLKITLMLFVCRWLTWMALVVHQICAYSPSVHRGCWLDRNRRDMVPRCIYLCREMPSVLAIFKGGMVCVKEYLHHLVHDESVFKCLRLSRLSLDRWQFWCLIMLRYLNTSKASVIV